MELTTEEKIAFIYSKIEPMEQDIRDLTKAVIIGNGKESLITRVSLIENKVSHIDGILSKTKQFWFWLIPTAISIVALYFGVSP